MCIANIWDQLFLFVSYSMILMPTDGLHRSLVFNLGMKWDMLSDLKTEPQKGLVLSNAFTFY